MLFNFEAVNSQGSKQTGKIEALNADFAINAIQQRGLVIVSIKEIKQDTSPMRLNISFFNRIKNKDIVMLSRQIATLFSAQISALRVFTLLAGESDNPELKKELFEVANDLQAGSSISRALAKHPKAFSEFYVNMVKAGEESGKLDQTFNYLADYLDRTYDVTSKAKNALVYPVFIIVVFTGVMIFMMTSIVPQIGEILKSSGQELPIYTQVIMSISDLLVNYGAFVLVGLILAVFFLYRYRRTESGKIFFSKLKLSLPFVGGLFKKLYLSRIADNLDTMLASAIPIVKSLEITASVVSDVTYAGILKSAVEAVRTGSSLSEAFYKFPEIPSIMVQMIRVGEETGELGTILTTLSKFYVREVNNTIDTVIGLIEPAMIIVLAAGVGLLLASVIVPIYNLTSAIN